MANQSIFGFNDQFSMKFFLQETYIYVVNFILNCSLDKDTDMTLQLFNNFLTQ